MASAGLLWSGVSHCSRQNSTSTSALDFDGLLIEGLGLCSLPLCLELGQKHVTNLVLVEAGLVQPRVSLQLLDVVAVFTVVAEELQDHVLEVGAEASAVDLFEVGVNLTGQEQVVEVLLLAGLLEGENALDNNEHDDTHAEKINLSTVIRFSFFDFGGHIRHRATVRLEVVDAFVASETEICNFQVQLIVYQNVLELEVTVHAAEVVHVLERVDHLRHEEAASVFSHCPHGLAQIE